MLLIMIWSNCTSISNRSPTSANTSITQNQEPQFNIVIATSSNSHAITTCLPQLQFWVLFCFTLFQVIFWQPNAAVYENSCPVHYPPLKPRSCQALMRHLKSMRHGHSQYSVRLLHTFCCSQRTCQFSASMLLLCDTGF